MKDQDKFKNRVIFSAEAALTDQFYVNLPEVLMRMGLLHPGHVQDWKKGKIPYLEQMIQGSLEKRDFAVECFQSWAMEKGLKPHKMIYLARARDSKKRLQFTESGHPTEEEVYHVYYISPLLSEKKQENLKKKLESPPELVAYIILKNSQCSQCNEELWKGSILYVEEGQSFCLNCAGFGDFAFLSSGNAALTRTAKKYSSTNLVVVRFSRTRKRYERQGLLVEEAALQKAEKELKINRKRIA